MESIIGELVGIWYMIMIGTIGMAVVAACFWLIIELGFLIKIPSKKTLSGKKGARMTTENNILLKLETE